MSVSHSYVKQAIVLHVGEKKLTRELVKTLQEEGNKNFNSSCRHIIWNFEQCDEITDEAYEDLVAISGQLKNKNIRVMLFSGENIYSEIIRKGLIGILPCYTQLKTDNKQPLSSRKELLGLITQSIQQTIKKLTKLDFQLGLVFKLEEDNFPKDAEVVGIIGVTSKSFQGSLILLFNKTSILELASRIMEEEFTTITPEVAGWPGEILNTSMGLVKSEANKRGENFSFSIPNTFTGSSLNWFSTSKRDCTIAQFDSVNTSFFLALTKNEVLP